MGGACHAPSRWIRLAIRSSRPGRAWTAIHAQPLSLPGISMPHGPREPVRDFGPLQSGQVPVIRVQADIEMENRRPVVTGAGGERVLQQSLFDVIGPLQRRPGPLLVIRDEAVHTGPASDDRALRQTLVR